MTTVKIIYEHNNKPLMGEGQVDEIEEEIVASRIKQIKAYYAQYVPELLNATWTVIEPTQGEDKPIRVVFNKQVGTKGNNDLIDQMVTAIERLPEFMPQVVALAHELISRNGQFDPTFIFQANDRIESALAETDTVIGLVSKMEQNLCQLDATLLPHPPLGF